MFEYMKQSHKMSDKESSGVQTPQLEDQTEKKKVTNQIMHSKQRIVIKKRVKKERPEGYIPRVDQAKQDRREENGADPTPRTVDKTTEKERKKVVYENMFKNFSANYANTLDDMINTSKDFLTKKA